MARLGSVLGGILAELTRARVVADELTKDLISEYENDPVLATLSVPRVSIGSAELVIRFTVEDVEEAPPEQPDVTRTRDDWRAHAETVVVSNALRRLNVEASDRLVVENAIRENAGGLAGRPRVTDIRAALGGNPANAVAATSDPVLAAWATIPPATRASIGTKAEFREALNREIETELSSFLDRQATRAEVRAALGSRLEVGIERDQLASESESRIQELRLTVSRDDLDVVVTAEE